MNLPPIEELIPHRGTMLLLDRMTAFQDESAVCEYMPKNDAWYADAQGDMPAWIGVELMAQTVAAHVGLLKHRQGQPFKRGALLGTRRYSCTLPVFETARSLEIQARVIYSDDSGLAAYECSIWAQGAQLASATLKVFEPDDFSTFLQANHS